MRYFVRVQRDNKWQLKYGPFPTLTDADIIAKHELRYPNTNRSQVLNADQTVKRDYSGDIINPTHKNKIQFCVDESTHKNGVYHLVAKFEHEDMALEFSETIKSKDRFVKVYPCNR